MTQEPTQSYTLKTVQDHATAILLVQGTNSDGLEQFAYVAIAGNKVQALSAALQEADETAQDIDIFAWGDVLACGLGTPPPDIIQQMQATYGIDHDLEETVLNQLHTWIQRLRNANATQ